MPLIPICKCHSTPCFTRICQPTGITRINTIIKRIPVGTYPLHKETPRQSQRDCLYPYLRLSAQRLEDKVRESQSKPSYKPSPVVAHADWMNHWRWRRLWRPSFSVTSAAVIACGRSCPVLSSVDITKCSWQMFMSLGQSTERHGHRRLVDLKHLKTYGWTERRMHLHRQYWFDQDVHTEIQQPVRTAGIITK